MSDLQAREVASIVTQPLATTNDHEAAHRLIEALNARLVAEHERAGTRGIATCGVLTLLVCGGVLLFAASMTSTTITVILLCGSLSALLVGVSISTRYEEKMARPVYERVIKPEIAAFCETHGYDPQQFNVLAHETLPKDAPLRNYLFGIVAEDAT